jgi:hypothetical protein
MLAVIISLLLIGFTGSCHYSGLTLCRKLLPEDLFAAIWHRAPIGS